MKSYNLPPLASSLTESIRDIGYSLNTAVADIIDNSISAEAKCVDIFSSIDKNSEIKFAIIDDGIGLPEKELVSAMRLGSQSPLVDRDLNDLGRFGLGMKTASFSQCRKLTVISSVEGKRSGAQWDLDWVSKTNKWDLQILNNFDVPELTQTSISRSKYGVLRGMHYQVEPNTEMKAVRCIKGALFDVIIDLRPESNTYKQWLGYELNEVNNSMLIVPEGCAHGFLTRQDDSEAFYLVSAAYNQESERGLRWDDPSFNIKWPFHPIEVSSKDRSWKNYE